MTGKRDVIIDIIVHFGWMNEYVGNDDIRYYGLRKYKTIIEFKLLLLISILV